MKIYLRILSVCYATGALLHLMDLFNLRLHFTDLPFGWRAWILFLSVADPIAAVGLWKYKRWGIAAFIFIAVAQLIAYVGFRSYFGPQYFLVAFHVVTLGLYGILKITRDEPSSQ